MELLCSSLLALFVIFIIYKLFPRSTPKSYPLDAVAERLLTVIPDVDKEQPDIAHFAKLISSYGPTEDYRECAEQMRDLLRKGGETLRFSAHEEDPSRILRVSGYVLSDNTALLTRFTVQYNLYAGSVVALGTDEQRKQLYNTQDKAELGCFAFTEIGAGVMTGVRVDTTATLTDDNKHFIITCPTPEARKNWISQGFVASKAVVLARLIIRSVDHGPHLFWVDFRDEDNQLFEGLEISLVPEKNSMNGLDNAIINFQSFKVNRTCLLSRFSSVDENGNFHSQFPVGCKRIVDLVLTRLLTGRLCLAEFSLNYSLDLLRHNWKYCTQRRLFRGNQLMAEINSINQFFANRARTITMLLEFIAEARETGCESIKNGVFTPHAVELASMAKYIGTGFALDTNFGLKKIMGSEALFNRSRLAGNTDVFLSTCFAEGLFNISNLKFEFIF